MSSGETRVSVVWHGDLVRRRRSARGGVTRGVLKSSEVSFVVVVPVSGETTRVSPDVEKRKVMATRVFLVVEVQTRVFRLV
ncbi:hypothetical protein F2Q68_00036397 [Brassica cretica]|uniref:Uncharacterized protein n=1 Tax=Brassica cretica TaxID=69181 RepID=A0A8S9HAE9_BRACR|nr:hypothetical protein F2Q68_00036397 [Brassica cretica]